MSNLNQSLNVWNYQLHQTVKSETTNWIQKIAMFGLLQVQVHREARDLRRPAWHEVGALHVDLLQRRLATAQPGDVQPAETPKFGEKWRAMKMSYIDIVVLLVWFDHFLD